MYWQHAYGYADQLQPCVLCEEWAVLWPMGLVLHAAAATDMHRHVAGCYHTLRGKCKRCASPKRGMALLTMSLMHPLPEKLESHLHSA